MKKNFMILLLLIFPSFCFAQQLRSQVCIIRPEYSEKMIENLKNLETGFKRLGITNPNEQLEKYLEKGSSGTGFVYIAPDGKNYIITSRRAIADSVNFTVVFQDDVQNEVMKFTGMKLFTVNADYDIAVLAFPNDEKPFKSACTVSDDYLSEGELVYAAGFMGNLGAPTWQLIPGSVIQVSDFIQHTIPIDAKNSGGPLLRRLPDNTFELVGYNIWSYSYQKYGNFAVTVDVIQAVIDYATDAEEYGEDPEEIIESQTYVLQNALYKFGSENEEIMDLISIDYVEAEGNAIFNNIYSSLPNKDLKKIRMLYKENSPVASLRYVITCYILQEFCKNDYYFSVDPEFSEDDLPDLPNSYQYSESNIWYTAFYMPNSNTYAKAEWINHDGNWELLSFKKMLEKEIDEPTKRLVDKGKIKKLDVRELPMNELFYTPSQISFSYGVMPLTFTQENFAHIADFEINLLNILALDITGIVNENVGYIFYEGNTYSRVSFENAFGGFQFQFPITRQRIIFMSYITVQGGANFSNWDKLEIQPLGRAEAGARLNLFLGKSSATVFVDANCQLLIDFKEFKPKLDVILDVGMSF